MKIVDQLGLGPNRKLAPLKDGNFLLTVTPPTFSGFSASSIELTEDQVRRYELWMNDRMSIQNAFPELTPDQREIIQSGIGPEEWDKLKEPEED